MFELHEGTKIESADGQNVGNIDRLVIDPSGSRVTHVVVRKGIFFQNDRVIPVDAIESADEDLVRLHATVDPDQIPAFEETNYVLRDEPTVNRLGRTEAGALAWAYPLAPSTGYPAYPAYPLTTRAEVERNVPDDSHVIEPGSRVVTIDGEEIGKIQEVKTDDDGHLTHITVDPGWFQSETIIPAHWVRQIDDDRVQIGVGADSLRDR
jgi:uncharacterized protein YrrD